MKKTGFWIWASLLVILALVIGVFGCAAPQPAAKPPTAPATPATTAAPAPGALKLKVDIFTGEAGYTGEGYKRYLQGLEYLSGGRVKTEAYWTSALLGTGHQVEGLGDGIADIAALQMAAEPLLPLMRVTLLPNVSMQSLALAAAMSDLSKHPAIKAEWDKNKIVFLWGVSTDMSTVMSKKPILKLEDIKGQRLHGAGTQAKIGTLLGATMTAIPAAEIRDAGDKGIIDGVISVLSGAARPVFAWHEWMKYYYGVNAGVNSFIWAMNRDRYNSLPDDIKKILASDQLTLEYGMVQYLDVILRGTYDGQKLWLGKGNTMTNPTPEEQAKIDKLIAPLHEDWIKEMEGKGLPGRDVYNTWISAVKKWEAFFAFPRGKAG
ncbi:MAG: hypothetical protein HYX79_10000 [Chloroflexi bacterium]|nr:hypothetical protein [Chloroflexota bacterium]